MPPNIGLASRALTILVTFSALLFIWSRSGDIKMFAWLFMQSSVCAALIYTISAFRDFLNTPKINSHL